MNTRPKNLIAGAMKAALILAVAVFTGLLSYGFWSWTFPTELWYYAILGFGLTGGGAIVYLIELVWGNNSDLRKTITLIMMVVCMAGEILTAGYGIKLEILTRTAVTPTAADFRFMTTAVQVLILLHFVALIAYFAGDTIIEMFELATGRDINRDGRIGGKNVSSRNTSSNNASNSPKSTPSNAPKQQEATSYDLPAFLGASGMKTEGAFSDFLSETEGAGMAWKVLRDGQSRAGYKLPPGITHANFNSLAGMANPSMAERARNNGHS